MRDGGQKSSVSGEQGVANKAAIEAPPGEEGESSFRVLGERWASNRKRKAERAKHEARTEGASREQGRRTPWQERKRQEVFYVEGGGIERRLAGVRDQRQTGW